MVSKAEWNSSSNVEPQSCKPLNPMCCQREKKPSFYHLGTPTTAAQPPFQPQYVFDNVFSTYISGFHTMCSEFAICMLCAPVETPTMHVTVMFTLTLLCCHLSLCVFSHKKCMPKTWVTPRRLHVRMRQAYTLSYHHTALNFKSPPPWNS